MGIRNKKRETLRRLDSKTLDARFLTEIRNGLNCSPFRELLALLVVAFETISSPNLQANVSSNIAGFKDMNFVGID